MLTSRPSRRGGVQIFLLAALSFLAVSAFVSYYYLWPVDAAAVLPAKVGADPAHADAAAAAAASAAEIIRGGCGNDDGDHAWRQDILGAMAGKYATLAEDKFKYVACPP